MNRERADRIDELLNAYSDGTMDADARAELELLATKEPDLAESLALQTLIDARLRAIFEPLPVPADHPVRAGEATATSGVGHTRVRKAWLRVLIAASILLVVGAGAAMWYSTKGYSGRPDRLYAQFVREGFQPAVVCTTSDSFAEFTRSIGQTLVPGESDPGVELVGWSYEPESFFFESGTYVTQLLARVDGREVVVFMAPSALDRKIGTAERLGDLRIFRREFGSLSLYEVTPLDQARVSATLRVGE